MVDAGGGCGRYLRLGVIGNAEAGAHQHRKIVGAVADGEHIRGRDAEPNDGVFKGRELGGATEDRLGDPAGEFAGGDLAVRWPALASKPAIRATRSVKTVKPPETSSV